MPSIEKVSVVQATAIQLPNRAPKKASRKMRRSGVLLAGVFAGGAGLGGNAGLGGGAADGVSVTLVGSDMATRYFNGSTARKPVVTGPQPPASQRQPLKTGQPLGDALAAHVSISVK